MASSISRRRLLGSGTGLLAATVVHKLTRGLPRASAAEHDDNWSLPARDLEASRLGDPLDGANSRWRNHLDGGVTGASAMVGNRVFTASLGGTFAAVELGSGTDRWRREFGTATYGSGDDTRELGFFGGVAVAGKRAIAASDRVFCVDTRTGDTVFASPPLRTDTSDDYFWGPPVIAGRLVLVGSGSGAELPTARGRLTAYALKDGSLVWSTPMVPEGANGGGVIGPPSVDLARGVAYVATGSPYQAVEGDNPGTCALVELRLRDGSITWSDQVYAGDTRGFDFNSAPVIIGRLLVAANKDGFYAWDRLARRRVWHRRLTPSLSDGSQTSGPLDGPEGGPVATDGDRVYVLSNDAAAGGCVAAALEPCSGNVLWQRELPTFCFAAPALAGDRLCFAGSDGSLRILSADDGSVQTEIALNEPSACAAAAAHGRLVVGTGAGPFLPGDSLVCIG